MQIRQALTILVLNVLYTSFAFGQGADWLHWGSLPELSRNESKVLTSFLNELSDQLPPRLVQQIKGNGFDVKVEFEAISDRAFGYVVASCDGNQPQAENVKLQEAGLAYLDVDKNWFSRPTRFRIVLNQRFLREILAGPGQSTQFNCLHKNGYQYAKASVIHEIGHIYDLYSGVPSLSPQSPDLRNNLKYCREDAYKDAPLCRLLHAIHDGNAVSDSFPFRQLGGWLVDENQNKNALQPRSPDAYEFYSREEGFAVNFEYFTLDPEFKCRRPAMYQVFKTHFEFAPFAQEPCHSMKEVLFHQIFQRTEIDPDRVYEIHYLLAAPGDEISSMMGHAMFRLVICDPEREKVSAECLKDIEHHVVVSYRAQISGMRINNWDGLVGNYPSRAYFFTMAEVAQEYNVGEQRALKSVPIKLGRQQINLMVGQVLEHYWSYSGKYYFLGNNCATEARDLLAGVLNDYRLFERFKNPTRYYVTPINLYNSLKRLGYLDESVLTSPESMGRYLFPAFTREILAAYEGLKELGAIPTSVDSVEEFVDNYGPKARRDLFEQIWPRLSIRQKKAAVAYFSIFELHAQTRLKEVVKADMGALLDENSGMDRSLNEQAQALVELTRESGEQLYPWNMTMGGYGVPLQDEVIEIQEMDRRVAEFHGHFKELEKIFGEIFPHHVEQYESIAGNLRHYVEKLESAMKPVPH